MFVVGDVRELWPFLVALVLSLLQLQGAEVLRDSCGLWVGRRAEGRVDDGRVVHEGRGCAHVDEGAPFGMDVVGCHDGSGSG